MTDEIKNALQKSARLLRSNGGMKNKEIKPLIFGIERIIRQRRSPNKIKRA